MGIFGRYVRGCRRFQRKVETDRQVVNVLDWDINDVFNLPTQERLTGTVTDTGLAQL